MATISKIMKVDVNNILKLCGKSKIGSYAFCGIPFSGSSYVPGNRGIFGGGAITATVYVNTIDYITIDTTGNAADFGDLTLARRYLTACSDGHGGLT